jgi:MFS family permease
MNYRRNLSITYAFEFLMNVNFMQALWMTYLAFKGLSLWEIGLAESMFHVVSLIMEVPTGVIADLYGRKISRLLGTLMRIIYLLILYFVDSLPMALLAFTFTALSYNLESGSDTALIYDGMIADGMKDEFTQVQGKREVILQFASIIGVFTGGLLADISYAHVISLTLLVTSLALGVGLFFIESPYQKSKQRPSLKEHFKSMWIAIKGQSELLSLMALAGFFLSAMVSLHFYIGIYLKDEGMTLSQVSLYLLISPLGGMVTGLLLKHIDQYSDKILRISPLLVSIFLGLVLLPVLRIPSLFILGALNTLIFVFTNERINEKIESAQRASLLSVNGMVYSVVMVVLFPLIGYIGDLTQLRIALMFLAYFTGLMALIFLRWGQHHLQKP